jgi:hypothetical protein
VREIASANVLSLNKKGRDKTYCREESGDVHLHSAPFHQAMLSESSLVSIAAFISRVVVPRVKQQQAHLIQHLVTLSLSYLRRSEVPSCPIYARLVQSRSYWQFQSANCGLFGINYLTYLQYGKRLFFLLLL